MSGNRTPIAARGAERAAIVRALSAGLTGTEWRVFAAICLMVTKYDRLEDRIANRQLVDLTGVDGRHVRRAVRSIASKGVIEREPGTSKTVASLYRFPIDEGADLAPEPEGAEVAPLTDLGGQVSPVGGADVDPLGGASAPTSEALSEASPKQGEPAHLAARRLVKREPFEADAVVHALEDKHGPEPVADLIASYVADNVRVSFASELRKRLDRDLPAVANGDTSRRSSWQPCGSCVNGMVETDAGVTFCTCHPSRAIAATA